MKKILNWFFGKLDTNGSPNWLSIKYYHYKRRKSLIREYEQERYLKTCSEFFEVPGAGKIAISNRTDWSTGGKKNGVVGFDFGVSWGSHEYSGGVLGRKEAKRLAEFILEKLAEDTRMEEEILSELWAERKKQYESI